MRSVHEARRTWSENNSPIGAPSGVELTEWQKESWTYHAKGAGRFTPTVLFLAFTYLGIWVSPTHAAPPQLTLFGSTNLNSRSANLDTELSFVMLTSSSTLREQLRQELDAIRSNAVPWQGSERHVRFLTKVLVGLVAGML